MSSRTLLIRDIMDNLKSFSPISRNGWIIKLSTYRDTNIMLVFCSFYTGQSFIKFFEDENTAVDYINIVISKKPDEYDNKTRTDD